MEKDTITLTKIEAWKTSDAKIFEYQTDALEHEKLLDFNEKLEIIINEFNEDTPFFSEANIVREFIQVNKNKLKELFIKL